MKTGILIVSDDNSLADKNWYQLSNSAFQQMTGLDLELETAFTEKTFKLNQQNMTRSSQSLIISQSDLGRPSHTQQETMTLRDLLVQVFQKETPQQVTVAVR